MNMPRELKPDYFGHYQVMINNPDELMEDGVQQLLKKRGLGGNPNIRVQPKYIFFAYSHKEEAELFLEKFRDDKLYKGRIPFERRFKKGNNVRQRYRGIGYRRNERKVDEENPSNNYETTEEVDEAMARDETTDIPNSPNKSGSSFMDQSNDNSNKKEKNRKGKHCRLCGTYFPDGLNKKDKNSQAEGNGKNSRQYALPVHPSTEDVPKFPGLVLAQDLIDYERMMRQGVPHMVRVFVTNFPLHYVQGSVYKLCNRFVEVLHVEIRNNMTPTEITKACVYVGSEEEATFLKDSLHDKVVGGKFLKIFKESDVDHTEVDSESCDED